MSWLDKFGMGRGSGEMAMDKLVVEKGERTADMEKIVELERNAYVVRHMRDRVHAGSSNDGDIMAEKMAEARRLRDKWGFTETEDIKRLLDVDKGIE